MNFDRSSNSKVIVWKPVDTQTHRTDCASRTTEVAGKYCDEVSGFLLLAAPDLAQISNGLCFREAAPDCRQLSPAWQLKTQSGHSVIDRILLMNTRWKALEACRERSL